MNSLKSLQLLITGLEPTLKLGLNCYYYFFTLDFVKQTTGYSQDYLMIQFAVGVSLSLLKSLWDLGLTYCRKAEFRQILPTFPLNGNSCSIKWIEISVSNRIPLGMIAWV